MKRYNPDEIEKKWQKIWDENDSFVAKDFDNREKMMISGMFPYPSGSGLHVGHARSYTIVDILARFHRAQGKTVLNPIGFDSFGLPTENYAIKTGISPQSATEVNIKAFKNQFKRLGNSFDWSRELTTSDQEYYRWTQWIFARLFENGLAYQKSSAQWFCPFDKTVLANEQVINGKCWRCEQQVEKKKMKQWFFKITDYAEELLSDIETLDWPEHIKTAQRNWIGKSQGEEIEFEVVK